MVTKLAEQIEGPLRAEVHVHNLPSARIAIAAGMHLEYTKDGVMYFYRGESLLENCPSCNHKVTKIAFRKNEYFYKRCENCDMLFVANHLQTDMIYMNYSKSYFEANSLIANASKERHGYPSYMEAQDSLKRSFIHKLKFVHRFSTDGRLLDIGAAYGTFLTLAQQYYECYGLDVSEYAALVARERFGVDVHQANIEQSVPFPDNHFDVVVMWDVIEHLVNPVNGLKEVYRVLKSGGIVFISTDNANNWLPRLLGPAWWSLAAPLHLCHFSKESMRVALRQAGEFERVEFATDPREYRFGEIVSHFGVSYKNKFLLKLGAWLEQTSLGSKSICVTRPEQFIAFSRKK
jgi:SAM-dependent methyltransferase